MSRGVCVLGMMRSGTSAVAGILDVLGVYLGDPAHLLAPHSVNPTGFREHREIIAVNDTLLERGGGSWYNPPTTRDGWQSNPGLEDLRARGSRIINEELASAERWGWKDPRTCLTLPFWQSLAPDLTYIVCVRNPVETARSLAAMPWVQRRIADPFARGLDLWLRYTTDALAFTTDAQRHVVLYDALLEDPDQTLTTLARVVGLSHRLCDHAVRSSLDDLLQPSLRHQVAPGSPGEHDEPDHPAHELFVSIRASYVAAA